MRGEVYSCSGWTALRAAELYYLEGRSQKEIGEALGLSPATVSRALRRAREEGYIRFAVPEPYAAHLSLARALCARFGLRDAVVTDCAGDAEARKRAAALEGARYLNIPLSRLNIRPGVLVSVLVRSHHNIIPFGGDHIEAGDTVILTAKAGTVVNLEDAFDLTQMKK